MGKSSTSRRNPRALAATRRQLAKLGDLSVKVGWSVEMGASPETVNIATINVLGAPSANIPPRDPITPAVRGNANTIRGFHAQAVRAVNRGEDPTKALERLARYLDREVEQSVRDLSDPPNKSKATSRSGLPSTVEKKGFDDALVGAGGDGGRLVAEVGATVVKRAR